jgi:TolC family type I secretion outer membrane protein
MTRNGNFLFGLISISLLLFFGGQLNALTLNQAYRAALEHNEQLHVSRERQKQAEQNVTIAKSRLYPELSVTAETRRQKELSQSPGPGVPPSTFQPEENYQYQLELRHRLYHGGKTWFGWSLRSQEAQVQSFRHYRRRQEILFEVARRYYDVLLARRNYEIAKNTLARSRNQLERMQGRLDVGEGTRTNLLRTEVTVSRSKQELRSARNDLDVAKRQLGLSVGLDSAPRTVEEVTMDGFDENLDIHLERAFENRWDLRQARASLRAARERVKWERADYFPSLDLVSQYSDADKPRFSDETENWNVRLVGSYPLFSGWRESAEVDQALSQYDAMTAEVERLRKEIRVSIRSVYEDVKTQRDVIQTAKDEVESARQNYERVSAEFEEGLVSAVDVDDALRALQESEGRLARARYNYQLGILRLRLATGVFKKNLLEKNMQ